MKLPHPSFKPLILIACLLAGVMSAALSLADELTVAVTPDFDFTLDELKQEFESQSGHVLRIVPGTSAQLYAQILDGARFDIFLSDDALRLEVLEREGKIITDSRFTYAHGRLVLWSVNNRSLSAKVLQEKNFDLLAVANPRLAPYGKAAKEFLEAIDLWEALQDKIVIGENIGQAYQFGVSGDVDIALIAFSQIIYGRFLQAGSYWLIPENYYTPIELQGGLLNNSETAREFLEFMRSEKGREIIRNNGFQVS